MSGRDKHRERSHKTYKRQAQAFGYYMGGTWARARARQDEKIARAHSKSLVDSLLGAMKNFGNALSGADKKVRAQ